MLAWLNLHILYVESKEKNTMCSVFQHFEMQQQSKIYFFQRSLYMLSSSLTYQRQQKRWYLYTDVEYQILESMVLSLRTHFSFQLCFGGEIVAGARMYWHWRLTLPAS